MVRCLFSIQDIYLIPNPLSAGGLLSYMATIRQAASRRQDFAWRSYDEQFRMRQETFLQPWSKLNTDLWLKIMTSVDNNLVYLGKQSPQNQSSPFVRTRPCLYFNKGHCSISPCKFRHVCSECGGTHPKMSCHSFRNQGGRQHAKRKFTSSSAATSTKAR